MTPAGALQCTCQNALPEYSSMLLCVVVCCCGRYRASCDCGQWWCAQINKRGCITMGIWVVCLIFYFYVRITKTMDLGRYLAYGIFVLIVEVRRSRATTAYREPVLAGLSGRLVFASPDVIALLAHRARHWKFVVI